MPAPPAFDIIIDPDRNLVRTRFVGNITEAAMKQAVIEVEALLPQVKPGFSIFANLGQVESMDLDSARPLTQIMDLCRVRGVALIVRILPPKDRDIGINLLSIVHYRGRVRTVTVESVAEAERILG
jgi:hypothetical protein